MGNVTIYTRYYLYVLSQVDTKMGDALEWLQQNFTRPRGVGARCGSGRQASAGEMRARARLSVWRPAAGGVEVVAVMVAGWGGAGAGVLPSLSGSFFPPFARSRRRELLLPRSGARRSARRADADAVNAAAMGDHPTGRLGGEPRHAAVRRRCDGGSHAGKQCSPPAPTL